jgi:hypothetical protein
MNNVNMLTQSSTSNATTNTLPLTHHISSTRHHRRIQRANAGSQMLGAGIAQISITALIPIKVAQTILSGQAFFQPKTKPIERGAHAIQASLSCAQLLLISVLYFRGNNCDQDSASLCKMLVLLDLIYQGILLVSCSAAEISKEKEQNSTEDDDNGSQNPRAQIGSPHSFFVSINDEPDRKFTEEENKSEYCPMV